MHRQDAAEKGEDGQFSKVHFSDGSNCSWIALKLPILACVAGFSGTEGSQAEPLEAQPITVCAGAG